MLSIVSFMLMLMFWRNNKCVWERFESGKVFLKICLFVQTNEMVIRRKWEESFLAEQVSRVTSFYSNVPKAFSCDGRVNSSFNYKVFRCLTKTYTMDFIFNETIHTFRLKSVFSPISPSSAPPSDLVAQRDSFLRATWTNLVEMLLVTMMWRHSTFLSCYGPVWKIKWQQTQAVKIIDTSPNIESITIPIISYHMD